MGMEDPQKKLFDDLERYILEHWRPEGENDNSKAREEICPDEISSEEICPVGTCSEEICPAKTCSEENDLDIEDLNLTIGRSATKSTSSESFRGKISKGAPPVPPSSHAMSLEELIERVGKSFHEILFEKIIQSNMTDVEVYKRANIDRKLFSKIRNNPAYHPRKSTVLALSISMKLDLSETEELLTSAGYAFSPGSKSDVIVRYFIERGVHDIHTINIALYEHGLPILE